MNDPFLKAEGLFLAQKIQVSMNFVSRIDQGREVPRDIISVTAISQWERERNCYRNLLGANEFAGRPLLTIDQDLSTRYNWVKKRLAIMSKRCVISFNSFKEGRTFSVNDGKLINSRFFPGNNRAEQVISLGVTVGKVGAILGKLF